MLVCRCFSLSFNDDKFLVLGRSRDRNPYVFMAQGTLFAQRSIKNYSSQSHPLCLFAQSSANRNLQWRFRKILGKCSAQKTTSSEETDATLAAILEYEMSNPRASAVPQCVPWRSGLLRFAHQAISGHPGKQGNER